MSGDLSLVFDEHKLYLRTEDDVDRVIGMGLLPPELKPLLLQKLEEAQGGIVIVQLVQKCPDPTDDCLVSRPEGSYH